MLGNVKFSAFFQWHWVVGTKEMLTHPGPVSRIHLPSYLWEFFLDYSLTICITHVKMYSLVSFGFNKNFISKNFELPLRTISGIDTRLSFDLKILWYQFGGKFKIMTFGERSWIKFSQTASYITNNRFLKSPNSVLMLGIFIVSLKLRYLEEWAEQTPYPFFISL